METIRNYLENMFLGLPLTDDIIAAKEELLGMMEDKYQELKNEGKTENEAIGIVISEFGNLDELAETLGIKATVKQKTELPIVSYERAEQYIEEARAVAPKTALGVWLCIMSPTVLLTLLGLYGIKLISVREDFLVAIGLICIIVFVAIAVSIFIRYSGKLDEYEDLQEIAFKLDYKTEQMVSEVWAQEKPNYSSAVSSSVIAYIISGLPVIVSPLLIENEGIPVLAVVVTLTIVAFATYNLISKGGVNEACKVLLQVEDYEIKKKSNKTYKVVSQVYWLLAVAIYLGYSFITNNWHISWIIWPVAGVLFGAIKIIILR
ncbi:MAG: hypothetical protein GX231_02315 [Tissierellia bacterium]|nr:hypothetical protein [Tissierellia bacterium]